ncbi:MAG: hypothetical protein PHR00_01160 [Patescibacteria group bacterium]|nr:hypothetical protein [Patescibacteria group bacterium]
MVLAPKEKLLLIGGGILALVSLVFMIIQIAASVGTLITGQ